MTIFCSAQEFDGLCGAIAGKAESIHLQAKGGSMYPFIRSGDWVDVVLTKRDIRKGDIILFRKGPSLYLHRVLSRSGDGFLVKGDMSSGADGVIPLTDILARAVSIHRGRRRIDLRSRANRIICILAADVSRVVRLPLWLSGNICRAGAHCLSGLQRLRAYRRLAKRHLGDGFRVREAEVQDEEGLRDLYLMAGHDVREGLARMKRDGFWLVAERAGKLALLIFNYMLAIYCVIFTF
jgi:hypothetical protein